MICPNCKKIIPDGSIVCGYCGVIIDDYNLQHAKKNDAVEETVQLSYEDAMKIKSIPKQERDLEENKDTKDVGEDIAKQAAENLSKNNDELKADEINQSSISSDDKQRLEQAAVPIKSSDMMNLEQLAKKRRPVSTAGFFFMKLALVIPIVNIFLLFIWAFRKKTNQNRQAYARSILIWLSIIILIVAVVVIALLALGFDFNYMYSQIREVIYTLSNM